MKTLICNCNQTMTLDAAALSLALSKTPGAHTDGLDTVHTLLCRREALAFQRAAKATSASGDELLVACTQEARLFLELNEQTEGAAPITERPIRFVNIRETGGWSRDKTGNTRNVTGTLPRNRTFGGTRKFTCNNPEYPGAAPAYNNSAGTPPTSRLSGKNGTRKRFDSRNKPSPVPYSVSTSPALAG